MVDSVNIAGAMNVPLPANTQPSVAVADPVANGFGAVVANETLIAQSRPVDPFPPGQRPTLGSPSDNTGIGAGLQLIFKAIRAASNHANYNEARSAVIEHTQSAINDLQNAPQGSFVEIRGQYRTLPNGDNQFVDMTRTEVRSLDRLGGEELRAPLPPGVQEYQFRIHNIPNADLAQDPDALSIERATAQLDRLRR